MSIVSLGVKGYVVAEELDVVQADERIFPFGCGCAILTDRSRGGIIGVICVGCIRPLILIAA